MPKGSTPDKVKDTLKAKAEELIKTPDFPSKVPEGYTVTVGEIPELPADIANKKGEPVVVKVPVTFYITRRNNLYFRNSSNCKR